MMHLVGAGTAEGITTSKYTSLDVTVTKEDTWFEYL
jgi:hypothetical protein